MAVLGSVKDKCLKFSGCCVLILIEYKRDFGDSTYSNSSLKNFCLPRIMRREGMFLIIFSQLCNLNHKPRQNVIIIMENFLSKTSH